MMKIQDKKLANTNSSVNNTIKEAELKTLKRSNTISFKRSNTLTSVNSLKSYNGGNDCKVKRSPSDHTLSSFSSNDYYDKKNDKKNDKKQKKYVQKKKSMINFLTKNVNVSFNNNNNGDGFVVVVAEDESSSSSSSRENNYNDELNIDDFTDIDDGFENCSAEIDEIIGLNDGFFENNIGTGIEIFEKEPSNHREFTIFDDFDAIQNFENFEINNDYDHLRKDKKYHTYDNIGFSNDESETEDEYVYENNLINKDGAINTTKISYTVESEPTYADADEIVYDGIQLLTIEPVYFDATELAEQIKQEKIDHFDLEEEYKRALT
eukprot:Pgem_evm1s3142